MVEIIKNISELNAVSGDEKSLRDYIICNINADEVQIDTMGNIIALKKGALKSEKKLAVVTHIDECGMIVTDITDDGYIKFATVGKPELRSIISKPVIINNKIPGIIGMKAVHLQKKEERETVKKATELFIDIGAKNKEDAKEILKKGDYISFATKFMPIGKNIKGKALDRVGVYSVMQAMNNVPAYDTYFVFTVQKEVGMRGAMIAANKINPDTVIVVDSAETSDMYGVKKEEINSKLNCGAIISYSDISSISDRALMEQIISLAKDNNIKLQQVSALKGISDAGEVMLSNNGTKAVNICIPVRYTHTPVQIACLNDIENTNKLLNLLLKSQEI